MFFPNFSTEEGKILSGKYNEVTLETYF